VDKLLKARGEGSLSLKDLLTIYQPSGRADFAGFVGRLKRGEADLLIPQGLLAKLLRKTSQGLLNLKDLRAVFLPTFRGLGEKRANSEASFLSGIAPNSAIFPQKSANDRRKSLFFATDFNRTCQALRPVNNQPHLEGHNLVENK
jgi:hypothetical protein